MSFQLPNLLADIVCLLFFSFPTLFQPPNLFHNVVAVDFFPLRCRFQPPNLFTDIVFCHFFHLRRRFNHQICSPTSFLSIFFIQKWFFTPLRTKFCPEKHFCAFFCLLCFDLNQKFQHFEPYRVFAGFFAKIGHFGPGDQNRSKLTKIDKNRQKTSKKTIFGTIFSEILKELKQKNSTKMFFRTKFCS